MKLKFDITPQEFVIVEEILATRLTNNYQVWVFGSRAKNKALFNSDLDLALAYKDKIPIRTLKQLKTDFEKSKLPYRVDVLDINAVDPHFQKIINQKKNLFPFKRKNREPRLRFPEFSGEWKENKLGDLFNYKNGGSFENEVVEDGLYNLITLNSITIDGELKNAHKKINSFDNSLKRNDLIMVLSDVAHGNFLGLTAIIPEDNSYVLNQRMGALKSKGSNNVKFLRLLINYNQKYFKLHGQGSSQQNLSKGDILKFELLLPYINEQTKIANFLSSIDNKIEQLGKKQELLDEYKKGLMQKIFSQAIRFNADDGSDFPDWEEKKLGEIANFKRGKNILEDKLGDKLLLGMGSVTEKGNLLTNKYTSDQHITLSKNDLVMPERDIGKGLIIGRVTLIDKSDKYVLGANILSLTINSDNSSQFLFQIINENNFRKKVRKIVNGSAQLMITSKDVKSLKLILPTVQEQTKIANFLSFMDNKIEQVGKQLDKSKQFKKALLQQMFV